METNILAIDIWGKRAQKRKDTKCPGVATIRTGTCQHGYICLNGSTFLVEVKKRALETVKNMLNTNYFVASFLVILRKIDVILTKMVEIDCAKNKTYQYH